MKIPISHFVIESDFRENREGIGELALSIHKDGLLQPIVVEQSDQNPEVYDIKVGRRRFTALKEYLKLEFLEEGRHFIVREGLDSLVAQLSENLNRIDFKPVEVARLIKAIHKRGIKEHGLAVKGRTGGWGIKDTAKIVGRDKAFVSRLLKAADNEELIVDCSSINEAVQVISRETNKNLLKVVRKEKIEKASMKSLDEILSNYVCTDALSFLKALPDNSIDLIYTDPPFGIDLDKIADDSYEDKIEVLKDTLTHCIPEYARVLKPDKYIIMWTSFILVSWVYDEMVKNKLSPAKTPIIWSKLNTSGRAVQVKRSLPSASECAVYGWSGPGAELTIQGRGNTFPHPIIRTNRVHVAQKPEGLNSDIIRIFSRKKDTVLDTFAGSASTLRSCIATERNFVGCEQDQEFYERGISYTLDWLKAREKVAT